MQGRRPWRIMGLLNDIIAADALFLADEDMGFGESVAYTPYGKPAMTLTAIVVRQPPEKTGAAPRLQSSQIQIYVPKCLLPNRPVLDGDQVQVGGVTKPMTVVKILDEHDPGMWHLVVN